MLPPESSNDSQLLERRRALKSGVDSVSSPASTGAPRHVAVVMDGNRRFGRVMYGDPLKVCVHACSVAVSRADVIHTYIYPPYKTAVRRNEISY